ncbi:MAG: oligosaccharide flippase family protein [Acutalibacteraceae bacterium]|nr:oligosaccharide flippase family protein [Acutalibacteraceae bacterium]
MNILKKVLKKYNDIPIAAKAALWFMFCSILQKSMSIITTPIFTRIMTTTQYGQFTVYNSWLQIFTIVTTLRLNYAVFNKGMSKYKDDRDGYTSTMQSLTFMMTVAVFIIYLIFHNQINAIIELPTFIVVAMFIELLVFPAVEFWTIRKRYEFIYKPIVFRTLLMTVLNAGVGVVAVFLSEEKGYARIMSCILVNFCFGIVLFVYNRKKGKVWFKKEYAKFAILFNLPLLLHYFSQYVLDQFSKIMIQKMVSVAVAGIYSVAYNLGMLMKIVTQSITNAIIPWQYEKLEKKQFKELDDISFLIIAFVSGCALVFSSLAPEIMIILADERYHEAMYAIPPIALGLVFSFMYTLFANVEFFYDKNKFTMYISMGVAALSIALNYIGIKLFGYLAAAYATLLCYILFAFGHYVYITWIARKTLGIDRIFKAKRLIILSVAVVALSIFMAFFYNYMLIRYAIIFAALIVLFVNRKKLISALKMTKSAKKSKN